MLAICSMRNDSAPRAAELIGPRFLAERQRLGLTQQAAARACDVSREVWGRYERGQVVPGLDVAVSFCRAGADPAYLLTGRRADAPALSSPPPVRRVAAAAHFFLPGRWADRFCRDGEQR